MTCDDYVALIMAEYLCMIMFTINLVPYLVGKLHLGISSASNMVNYFTATSFMVSVLGAFISDAYLGQYRTIMVSTVFVSVVSSRFRFRQALM